MSDSIDPTRRATSFEHPQPLGRGSMMLSSLSLMTGLLE